MQRTLQRRTLVINRKRISGGSTEVFVGNVFANTQRLTSPAKTMDVSSANPPVTCPSVVEMRRRVRRHSKKCLNPINPEEVGQQRFITTKKTVRYRVHKRQIHLIKQPISPALFPLNPHKQSPSSILPTKHRVKQTKQLKSRLYLSYSIKA